MEKVMTINSTNQISAGTTIFNEKGQTGTMYMVLKGKVSMCSRGFGTTLGPGSVLGFEQLAQDSASYSLKAIEDSSVYAISADSDKGLIALLGANKDYNGIAVYNHVRLFSELYKQYRQMTECTAKIYSDIKDKYAAYMATAKQYGCKTNLIPEISQLEPCPIVTEIDEVQTDLFAEYARIPYEAIKAFYTPSSKLSAGVLRQMAELESKMIRACAEMSDYLADTIMLMSGAPDYSLYRSLLCLQMDLKKKGADVAEIKNAVELCRTYLKNVKALIDVGTSREWIVEEDELDNMYKTVEEGGDFRTEDDISGAAVDSAIAETVNSLADSFHQIATFANYPEAKTAEFEELLTQFENLPDRESTDDEYRKLRKSMADHFYSLYLAAYMATTKVTRIPKAVELLLDYGYVSERLLRDNQLVELLSIRRPTEYGPCKVFTMREWLNAIYTGEKEPSRNDMGLDYAEYLREMKKTGDLSAEKEKELLSDGTKKVEFEIKNVLVPASRVVNGQLSIFTPVLHAEMFIGDIEKAYCSAVAINESFTFLTGIDFSVFYREALYVDAKAGIEREYEMKNVYPIFIQYPTVGQNVIMWQEITGRKRDTEGRFFTPSFAYVGMNDMMIKGFGQFRWALCKTIQGTNWNNIQVRSLTSEYSDYIQFYKKNHDLSDERKEKIKLQIQRGRNNLREVFTQDYEAWMKSEVNGSIKLNKIVREMLATYCPFSAQYKAALVRQPIYDEAFARNTRERNKKVHELELRYKALEAKGIKVPEPLTDTLEFYKSM